MMVAGCYDKIVTTNCDGRTVTTATKEYKEICGGKNAKTHTHTPVTVVVFHVHTPLLFQTAPVQQLLLASSLHHLQVFLAPCMYVGAGNTLLLSWPPQARPLWSLCVGMVWGICVSVMCVWGLCVLITCHNERGI